MSTPHIDAVTVQRWLHDDQEIAFIDIREPGLFGEGHPLLAINIPSSRLELDIAVRVPRTGTPIVLLAADATVVQHAANALHTLGYTAVHLLDGGAQAWLDAGLSLFQGVNVPSKAFAEFVEHVFHTPAIESVELRRLQDSGADLILLDSRTLAEHRRFHVPGAISCPGSELVARFTDLVPSPDTLVVVSCAGRTRGVMGAQTLIDAGVPNRVVALSGGTQGWRLSGLELQRSPGQESHPASTSAQQVARERAAAIEVASTTRRIDVTTLAQWQADASRTSFVFDIRTQEEFEQGHLPGSTWVQGVQLIQCLDEWAGVRNARVVLVDTDGSRAVLVAHWLHRLGTQVSLLDVDSTDLSATGPAPAHPRTPALSPLPAPFIDATQAKAWFSAGALVLDASSSAQYRRQHPAASLWVNRSALSDGQVLQQAASADRIIVLADDDEVAQLFAASLNVRTQIAVLQGGLASWTQAGLPVASSADTPEDKARIDYLFWLHDRHDGNLESSARYLQWEESLPALVGDPAQAGFRLPST